MNKFKVTIFILLAVIFVVFIGLPYATNFIGKNESVSPDNAEKQTLQKGEYIVGEDIKPGVYDFKVLKGDITYNSVQLSLGDKVLAQKLTEQEHIVVEGRGSVELSPAKFDPLTLKNDDQYIIDHSGNYKIGTQIPEGEYTLSYTVKGEKQNEKPFIQVLPEIRGDVLESFQFEKKENYNITLKSNYILEVHKSLFEEYDNVLIKLSPQ
ncbi:hypothetical protein [Alkalibacillus almallahensis]|uniref:hypothetical protein n=1 Tax=Alkalibacillus almallahensis TaxID=1379154 RepID=UPI001420BB64|nr:hypothetical protein [Alkalibacillus almallahensis]NIK13416.1 hypothetical protein [Alkalibacillus almallahensis]